MRETLTWSLLLTACGWLIGPVAQAAVFYVHPDGLDLAPYDTWTRAARQVSTVVGWIGGLSDPNHVIQVGPGTWWETTPWVLRAGAHHGLRIVGAGREQTVIEADQTLVVGRGADRVQIERMSLIGHGSAPILRQRSNSADWTLRRLTLRAAEDHRAGLIQVEGPGTDIRYCRFWHAGSQSPADLALFRQDASVRMAYCTLAACPTDYCIGALTCAGRSAEILNCAVLGFANYGIVAARGETTVCNSIVLGQALRNRARPAFQADAEATLTLSHSLIGHNLWNGTGSLWSGTGEVQVDALIADDRWPGWSHWPRCGVLLPCVDDSTSFHYARQLAGLLGCFGMRGTYFLTQSSWDPNLTDALRSMVAEGVMEVGSHAYSHSPLICRNALTIDYAGPEAGATVTLTPAGELRMETASGRDSVRLDLTTPSYATIGQVVALDGTAGWSLRKALTDGVGLRDACRTSSLATLSRTGVPATIELDVSGPRGYYQDEIVAPKRWLTETLINGDGPVQDPQTGTAYACHSFAAPFGVQSEDARQTVAEAGYWINRSNRPAGDDSPAPSRGVPLVAVDLTAIPFAWTQGSLDGNEAEVRAAARALAIGAIQAGLAVPVLAHNTDEMSLEQWTWALEEWSSFGDSLWVTSHQCFARAVRDPEGPWQPAVDGVYRRQYGEPNDLSLAADSVCLGAGLDLGRDLACDETGADQDADPGWDIGPRVRVADPEEGEP